MYTVGDIVVEPYKFIEIKEMHISRELNETSHLSISGIVNEDYKYSDEYVEKAGTNSNVKIYVKDKNNNPIILFYGVVVDILLKSKSNVKTLFIEALDNTFLMDIEKKTRVFQGDNLTYNEIFSYVCSGYENIDYINNVLGERNAGKIVVQFNESDKRFMERLVSHFNKQIADECRIDGIKFYIGQGERFEVKELDEFDYSATKSLREYERKCAALNEEFNEFDFIDYEITTYKLLGLNDAVRFKGKNLRIYKCEMSIKDASLINTYTLRSEEGLVVPKINNDQIAGVSLEGSIIDSSKDVVKVSLDIETYGESVWFPYSTVFSSPDGTGWYCMPENGDAVRLYFPSNVESDAYVISSVNLESSDAEKRSDPSVKSLSTKYGKELVMRPGGIDVVSGNNCMTLDDGGGITISSDSNLTLTGANITIDGKNVEVSADEKILLSKQSTSIEITENITMAADKINTQ